MLNFQVSSKELNNHIERAVTKGLLCFYPLNRQTFKSPQVEMLCNNDVIKWWRIDGTLYVDIKLFAFFRPFRHVFPSLSSVYKKVP